MRKTEREKAIHREKEGERHREREREKEETIKILSMGSSIYPCLYAQYVLYLAMLNIFLSYCRNHSEVVRAVDEDADATTKNESLA